MKGVAQVLAYAYTSGVADGMKGTEPPFETPQFLSRAASRFFLEGAGRSHMALRLCKFVPVSPRRRHTRRIGVRRWLGTG